MDFAINRAARRIMEPAHYDVTASTIGRNLTGRWVIDEDPFAINQFLHPYQGAMYHNIARSSGLTFWQALGYTFAGSALWEIAGETTSPSRNDQIASGIAGAFLGEPVFRTARLILIRGGKAPGIWRGLAATAVSPPAGLNRALFGDRFDTDAPGELPGADLRLELGMTAPLDRRVPSMSSLSLTTPFVGFSVDYDVAVADGSAAAPRPFDHFRLEGIASSGGFQQLATRGRLTGGGFGGGETVRGLWGLYGGYDYFAPDRFRVSSTHASFGTTLQVAGRRAGLRAAFLIGAGYTAAQSLESNDERDYHYGVAPQALGAVRLIAGRRAALDVTARGYAISDVGGFGPGQRDLIFRGDATLALRLAGRHALAVKYVQAERHATSINRPSFTQRQATLGVVYMFLGSAGFGALR